MRVLVLVLACERWQALEACKRGSARCEPVIRPDLHIAARAGWHMRSAAMTLLDRRER